MQWFKNLSTFWKVVLIAAILVIGLFIYDRFTGGISDLKGWLFDRQYNSRMEKIDELTKANDALRAQNIELEKKIVADEAKFNILQQEDKDLTAKQQNELNKLDQALQQQAQEEAITAEPIDNYTRCERTKQKLLGLNVRSAKEMNCDQYKQ